MTCDQKVEQGMILIVSVETGSFGLIFAIKILETHTPSCKKVVIGRKNFRNLVRKEYIKRQKKWFSFSDFLLSFNRIPFSLNYERSFFL